MSSVLLALAGGVVWMGLMGVVSPATFLMGCALSAAFGRLLDLRAGGAPTARGLARALPVVARLMAYFVWEVVISNLHQLRVVLALRPRLRPRWIRLDTELESAALRALLGLMISMTPGTLTCEVGRRTLFIHVLHAADENAVRERVRRRLEAPLRELEATR